MAIPRTARVLGIAGSISCMSGVLLAAYYQGALPKHASITAGRTYELQVHGGTVFMSLREAVLFYGLFLILPVVLGAVGAVIMWRARRTQGASV